MYLIVGFDGKEGGEEFRASQTPAGAAAAAATATVTEERVDIRGRQRGRRVRVKTTVGCWQRRGKCAVKESTCHCDQIHL